MSAATRAGVRAAMISSSRAGLTSRAIIAPVAAVRASSAVARTAAFVVQQGPASWGLRLKSTWASKPIITYEELKPITQQPNDVGQPANLDVPWLTQAVGNPRG